MKTKCFCIGCKSHPLHAKRKEFREWVTGNDGGGIWKSGQVDQGVDVECLSPVSDAFDKLGIDSDDIDTPYIAYGDGISLGYYRGSMFELWYNCENETFEEKE